MTLKNYFTVLSLQFLILGKSGTTEGLLMFRIRKQNDEKKATQCVYSWACRSGISQDHTWSLIKCRVIKKKLHYTHPASRWTGLPSAQEEALVLRWAPPRGCTGEQQRYRGRMRSWLLLIELTWGCMLERVPRYCLPVVSPTTWRGCRYVITKLHIHILSPVQFINVIA